MRTRILHLAPLAALATLIAPLASDAGIAVPPASKAPACATADRPLATVEGDERFFNLPGGVPNVMLLLDSSGSMLELPNEPPLPSSWPSSNGTCSLTGWVTTCTTNTDCQTMLKSSTATCNSKGLCQNTVPYDNGFSTAAVTDNPPWGLTKCTTSAEPTGDKVSDACLFRPNSTYKINFTTGGTPLAITGESRLQTTASAPVYNSHPCAAVDSSGNLIYNRSGTLVQASDVSECTSCLSNAGYYLFKVTYTDSSNRSQTVYNLAAKGSFMNAYPPKYVAARKVVKDLAKLDPDAKSPVDQMRLGLTVFTSGTDGNYSTSLRANDGGVLVVPLGPNCDDAMPPSIVKYTPARQAIIDAVNNTSRVTFASNTPLSETLFNIGQYFSDQYSTWMTSSWTRSSFNKNAAGTINASWATSGRQDSFCWSCQQSSVIIITDGEPNYDSNLPLNPTPATHATLDLSPGKVDFRKWSNSTIDCPACGNDMSYSSVPNALHKVAYFLKQNDLRLDLGNTTRGPQVASTYTISFGIDATKDPKAIAVLQKTADLGGGMFKNTSSGVELSNALNDAVTDVLSRTTSFTSANANALQTSRTSQADAYIARFRPTDAAFWEGHLFAAMIFDEFGEGCDSRFTNAGQRQISCGSRASMSPNLNGDSDPTTGNAVCTGAFLVDNDCDPIIEDSNGNYKKGQFNPTNPTELNPTANDAEMWWDAGKVLSDSGQPGYKSAEEGLANSRKIYTTLDVNGDGKLTAADGLVEFTTANAAAIAPTLGLDATTCITLLQNAHLCGASPMPACPAATSLTAADRASCASVVINFVRGWDVYDWDGDHCMGPGAWDNTHGWGSCTTAANCGTGNTCTSGLCYTASCPGGEQRDRPRDSRPVSGQSFWKLGDIFHSSPVLVRPPLDKMLCQLGGSLYNQCVQTIFSPVFEDSVPTPIATYGTLDAYDTWRQANIGRRQVVLVGANDGMLHAFDAGQPDTSKPRQYDGSYPYTTGTGSELWAFIPPDLLPRLKDALSSHQYFVDGTPMVRDVWVDLNHDGVKQSNEFRTVAVLSERSGGSRYSALDITDPTAPVFLWTFPDGCTQDSTLAGESWTDFLPRPPPIGPVRTAPQGADPTSRGYDERWVVMLSGGYDPTLVRGRAVWMLDVYTGQKLWQYTDADFKTVRGDNKASMFPVVATIGMVDIGAANGHAGSGRSQVDGMFDTATWGDLGGNIFLARMYEVGHFNATTGLIDNWTAARTFEQQRRDDDLQYGTGRSEYFNMTLNFPYQPEALRVLVGSGNRARMMVSRPTCGPDSTMGCAQNGCSAISAVGSITYGSGSCSTSGTFASASGALSYTPGTTSGCTGSFAAPAPIDRKATVSATCGSTTLSTSAERVSDSAGYVAPSPTYFYSPFSTTATFTPTTADPCLPKRFVSFWGYVGGLASKSFTTAAQARTFDANRFTDVNSARCSDYPGSSCKLVEVANAQVSLRANGNYSPTCMDGATKCTATWADPGWMYTYGKWCPEGAGNCSTTPPWCDEQTGAQASGFANCVIWPGFRPSGATDTTDPCVPSTGVPTSYTYFANWVTGIPSYNTSDGFVCASVDTNHPGVLGRGVQRSSYAVPQAPQMRVVVNDQGRVGYSMLKLDSGAAPQKIDLGQRSSTTQLLYWLEVPKAVHTCRHTDPSTCK